jgi:hypothetical protein
VFIPHCQIEKLRQQATEKEADLLALLERTPIEVWNEDLDRFLAQWEVWLPTTPLKAQGFTETALGVLQGMGGKYLHKFQGQKGEAQASYPRDKEVFAWPR